MNMIVHLVVSINYPMQETLTGSWCKGYQAYHQEHAEVMNIHVTVQKKFRSKKHRLGLDPKRYQLYHQEHAEIMNINIYLAPTSTKHPLQEKSERVWLKEVQYQLFP